MDKKNILIKEFVTNFKKNLNISVLYSRGHPLISKVVEDLHRSVNSALAAVNPIKIIVAGDFLSCEGINFSDATYRELARRLHIHKIKSIEISRGVTDQELNYFVDLVSMSVKEIIQHRAERTVKERMAHLIIEEIDYYELLDQDTGEYKDVWGYLLAEAVDNKNTDKVSRLADNFGKNVKNFEINNFADDDELRDNISKFLSYLKVNEIEKFPQCFKEIAKQVLNAKDDLSEEKIEKIKALFNSYSDDDLAEVLADNIVNAESFDNLSLGLFSKIVDAGKHSVVASLAIESLGEQFGEDKEKLQDKVKKLISAPEQDSVSEVYRNTLTLFLKNISYGKNIYFDRDSAAENYRLILLCLLLDESSKNWLGVIEVEIAKILDDVFKNNDFAYLGLLVDSLKTKKSQDAGSVSFFVEIDKKIILFLENCILTSKLPDEYEYLGDYIELSEGGIEKYLQKIFTENNVSDKILRLFFRIIPDSTAVFCGNLEKKYLDMDFMQGLVHSLKMLDSEAALEILEYIYTPVNNYIKIEILRAMEKISRVDKEFLMPILETGDIVFKKEALLILNKDEEARYEAFAKLFYLKGPWWKKNKAILDNIIVVGELGLKEAKDYLVEISKKRFFWNRAIRSKAREVLVIWQQQIK